MAELTISASVGAPPSPNRPDDVRTVQRLLGGVMPPLSVSVLVTGIINPVTINAIREFQRRFMSNPDGRVDPGERTLMHLNDGFSPQYQGCSPLQRREIDRDLINAQRWLDVVNRRLGTLSDQDMQRKVQNIFHIDVSDRAQSGRFADLRSRFQRLRRSLDESFPLRCEQRATLFAAYVDLNDPTGTIHFPPGHFKQNYDHRAETIIHERSHTVFHISHAGMIGAGELNFGQNPDDNNGFTYGQAIANGYCYGWLATSLQPGYVPSAGWDTIVVPRPRR